MFVPNSPLDHDDPDVDAFFAGVRTSRGRDRAAHVLLGVVAAPVARGRGLRGAIRTRSRGYFTAPGAASLRGSGAAS